MAGHGFAQSVAGVIQYLRNTLAEYSGSFVILKELIQNADDAGATEIEVGWSPGLPNAAHPLLQGPGLFAANNGRFTRSNAWAIRNIGLSDKPGETSAIGKFGLGLKSVFRICEAFFYVGGDGTEPAPHGATSLQQGFVNPWSPAPDSGEEELHAEWDNPSPSPADFAAVMDELVRFDPNGPWATGKPWFCLWVPLRRQGHCANIPPIHSSFPGDAPDPVEEVFHPLPLLELSELLPMLLHLEVVRIWRPGPRRAYGMEAEVRLDEASQRRRWTLEDDVVSTEWPLKGLVHMQSSAPHEVVFAGQEACVDVEVLRGLRRSPHWPKRASLRSGSYTIEEPDKAGPHGAVCFTRLPSGGKPGQLHMCWAVFLPVVELPVVELDPLPCETSFDVGVVLHGYFFVNPGRNQIDFDVRPGPGGNDAEALLRKLQSGESLDRGAGVDLEALLRIAWNRTLRDEVTMPQVLPALAQFVAHAGLSDAETAALTRALQNSQLMAGNFRERVCAGHHWVYRVGATGVSWTLVDGAYRLLELPEAVPEVYTHVFPVLNSLTTEHCITFNRAPRLSARTMGDAWPEMVLAEVLDVPASAFSNTTRFEYLAEFLQAREVDLKRSATAQDVLWRAVRRAIRELGLGSLCDQGDLLVSVLGLVPAERLLLVRSHGDLPALDSVLQALAGLDMDVLLVPDDVVANSGQPPKGRPTTVDTVQILQLLGSPRAEWEGERFEDLRSHLVVDVLRARDAQTPVPPECADLPLFRGFDAAKGSLVALSYRELRTAHGVGLLFSGRRELAMKLQAALGGAGVLVADSEVCEVLFPAPNRVSPCNPTSCVDTLLRWERLAPPEARSALLQELLSETPQDSHQGSSFNRWRQAVRYLLHGDSANRESNETLIVWDDDQAGRAWARLAREALRLLQGEWRLVHPSLARLLSEHQRQALDVHRLGPALAVRVLREVGPEQVSCGVLTDPERNEVILALDDLEVLQRLPIHRDIHGSLRSVGEDTYLEGTGAEGAFPNDDPLTGCVGVIARSDNPNVATRQRQLMGVWDAEAALREAFRQERPYEFVLSVIRVLEILARRDVVLPDNLGEELHTRPWLVTRHGTPVAPEYVVHLAGLDDELERMQHRFEGVLVPVGFLREELSSPQVVSLLEKYCLASEQQMLGLLGQVLAEDPAWRIGALSASELGQRFDAFLRIFPDAPEEVMPCARFVARVDAQLGREASLGALVPELLQDFPKPLVAERLIAILEHLRVAHTNTPPAGRDEVLVLHLMYLDLASRASDFSWILIRIHLLNMHGRWRPTKELCLQLEQGTDPAHILNPRHEEVLRHRLTGQISHPQDRVALDLPHREGQGDRYLSVAEVERQCEESVHLLGAYFREWEGRCPPGPIGAFIALLGGHQGMSELAGRYLDQVDRSRELVLASFEGTEYVRTPSGTVTPANASGLEGVPVTAAGDLVDWVNRYRFIVSPEALGPGDSIRVTNLLGESVDFPALDKFDHIFLGRILHHVAPNPALRLRIRAIDTGNHEGQLASFLRQSARLLLNEVYRQVPPNFDEVWDSLEGTGQLGVPVAQELLLDHFPFLARQLGVHNDPALSTLLRQWDEARKRKVETHHHVAGRRKEESARHAEEEQRRALTGLRNLLTTDPAVQGRLLEALRRKVRDFQYGPESVPFELFQNADDAVVELLSMHTEAANRPTVRLFALKWESEKLVLAHCGRLVNQYVLGSFDGRCEQPRISPLPTLKMPTISPPSIAK